MPDEPDAPGGGTDEDEDQPNQKPETDWKAEARKWQDRARANHGAVKELDKLKRDGMNDVERQVDEARKAAKAEALAEVAKDRAADAIRYSIGDRLPEKDVDELLDDLNLARFVDDDGKVDRKRVAAYVARVAPAKAKATDLGQGARGGGKPSDGSFLVDAIRRRQQH